MITVIQRVACASVTIDSKKICKIGEGLLILLGAAKGDSHDHAEDLGEKVAHLRIFEDEKGKMNRSLIDTCGSALVVSQFTLLANTARGRRPGFEEAAPPGEARGLYDAFVDKIRSMGIPTQTGLFGATMQVDLTNSGPVTLILESRPKRASKPVYKGNVT